MASAAYNLANRDKIREQCGSYYLRNAERLKEVARRWRAENPEKAKEYQRISRTRAKERDPEKWRANVRDRNLRLKYGISSEDVDAILVSQGGVCAMCRSSRPNSKHRVFHVDHDHATGLVRGVLCGSCNTSLGHYESVRLLAEAYLARVRKC